MRNQNVSNELIARIARTSAIAAQRTLLLDSISSATAKRAAIALLCVLHDVEAQHSTARFARLLLEAIKQDDLTTVTAQYVSERIFDINRNATTTATNLLRALVVFKLAVYDKVNRTYIVSI